MAASFRVVLACWQRKPEGAALVRYTANADGSAVALDNRLANVESEAQSDTGTGLLLDAGHAVKALEEVGLLLGGKAGAVV